MSGKEKAENFDDDFELDALDEASWAEEDVVLSEESTGDLDSSAEAKGPRAPKREKKSGGGFLTGILVLALLGGGSFYAYQSGLIPGLDAKGSASGESSMPVFSDESAAEAPADPTTDMITAADEPSADMPPMPAAAEEATALPSDDTIETAVIEGPAQDATGALTPMPGVEGSETLELSPLDSSDGEIEVAQVAEKDGMLLEEASELTAAAAESVKDEVAATGGKLDDGVMALPGSSADVEELPTSSSDSDALSLDESTLLGETEKTPESADSALEGAAVEQKDDGDVLNDLSDELATTQKAEDAAVPDADVKKDEPPSDPLAEEASPEAAEMKAEDAEISTPVAETESPASTAAVEVKAEEAEAPPAEEKASEPVAPAVEETASVSPAEPVKAAESPKPAKPAVLPNWVLKSAKPGIAVLYDKRTGDVKTVGVGDRVAGLGKIKSVSKIDGKWVVQGTTGKVRQ